ncbi:MAG: DEAD/DEAH box helicase [Spirochaetales bacterium]|nr:DEAD/DEAH box helicase [Spirochaetales bacterium]
MKFTELDIDPQILRGLQSMGYRDLTPIQELTFPHILEGKDLLATAETGSGKTSACGIPMVQRIDPDLKAIQALILVPTRELALQYTEEIGRIAHFMRVVPFAVYGGFDMGVQKAKLQDVVHILVATPGRLIDFLYSGRISLSDVQTFVLDEADEMLKEGFLEDIEFVFSCLIHERQTLLFSATMPPDIDRLASKYLNDPIRVRLNQQQLAPQSLNHHFQFVAQDARLGTLTGKMEDGSIKQAIIFCNSRLNAERLYLKLKDRHPRVDMVHGGMEQQKRSSVIRRLRNQQVRFMIATDLAGRGLDFTHVSHVINYDFPRSPVTYTHRTGRAGRMGREGTALTLVTHRDLGAVRRLITANGLSPTWIGREPDFPHRGRGERSSRRKRPRHRQQSGI